MKRLFTFLIVFYTVSFLMYSAQAYSTNSSIDSLYNCIKNEKIDTVKINHLNKLSLEYRKLKNYQTSIMQAKEALMLSQKINFQKGVLSAYNTMGKVYSDQGNYTEALKNLLASLKIKKDINDKQGIAELYFNIGINYYYQGNYLEALKNQKMALDMFTEINSTKALHSYNNIGLNYYNLGNYSEALQNHFAALKLSEKANDKKSIADSYDHIGIVYYSQNNYAEALNYFLMALKLREQLQDKEAVTYSHINIGSIYYNQGNYPEALKNALIALKGLEATAYNPSIARQHNNIATIYYDQGDYNNALKSLAAAIELFEKMGDKQGLASAFINISKVYIKLKKYILAEDYLNKALSLSIQTGSKNDIKESYQYMSVLDSVQGKWKQAYQHHQLFAIYRDSINNVETAKQTVKTAMAYEFEKKEHITKVIHEKEKQIANYQKYALIAFIIVVCLFAFFLINRQQMKITEQKRIYQIKQQLTQSELHLKDLETRQLKSVLDINQEKLNNYTNLIKEKTRIISSLEEKFETIKHQNSIEPTAQQLLAIIKENTPPNEYWDEFISNFNLVNKDFFNKLKSVFPDITRTELNYCALIKCNLSNKEIANILNITPDSAKRARNRLKKKLNLNADESLTHYITSL
ncbi:MAG: tetratricopeptide repeat protein [Bacteroidia bacterium]